MYFIKVNIMDNITKIIGGKLIPPLSWLKLINHRIQNTTIIIHRFLAFSFGSLIHLLQLSELFH